MKRAYLLILAAAQSGISQQPGGKPGQSLGGSLLGEDGTTIVGGLVTLDYVRPGGLLRARRVRPESRYATRTGAGGAFLFGGLVPGHYILCAQALKSVWLSSCDWGAQPIALEVTEKTTSPVKIVLKKGAVVTIRVDDPGRTLAQHEGKTQGAHLMMGTAVGSLFRSAVQVSDDAGGRNYQALVPFSADVKLIISSSFFQLADERGAPIQLHTTSANLRVAPGSGPPAIRLVVTGARGR